MKFSSRLSTTVLATFVMVCGGIQAQEKMKNKEITVDSIYLSPDFRMQGLSGIKALLEADEYYQLEDGVLQFCQRQRNGKVSVENVLDVKEHKGFDSQQWVPFRFEFNADKSKLLLFSAYDPIYRHSGLQDVVVWSVDKKGRFTKPVVLSKQGKIQEVMFSPDGTKVSYIRENDLYYYDLAKDKEVAVTTDGEINRIRNGHTDWVYEEEFGFTRAYDWNPDSKTLAFLRFDESGLKEYEMTMWGELYPQPYKYKYPKAGEDNSKVSLWFYPLDKAVAREVKVKEDSIEYLPRLFWKPNGKELVVYTLNRHQNHFRMMAIQPDGKQRVMYEERNPAYVEITDNVYFFKDGSQMLLATEKDGYNHLYLFPTDGSSQEGLLLTPGLYDVLTLYGVDETNGRVFFQAAYSSPANRDVMCVNLDGSGLRRPAIDLQLKGGSTYAYFDDNFEYMIVEHSKANQPAAYYLYHLGKKDEQLIACLKENSHLEETAFNHGFVEKQFFSLPVPFTDLDSTLFMDELTGMHRFMIKAKGGDAAQAQVQPDAAGIISGADDKELWSREGKIPPHIQLQAWMMKPAEIGTLAAEGKKYPVLMFLYGGPGSQQVNNELRPYQMYDYAWYQMLVQKGYIVVCVDGRGTGARGQAFKKCTYLELGKYETQDQVAAARFLGTLPYVDKDRIGIWGWSYGGFMSSNCLFRGEGTFRMAMAVAPVTNWKYYDNVYTERFMRTPQENPDGYELNSPIHYASQMKGAYLLVHGSADDNVHIQNSVDLITALQKADKQFEFVMYPNKNHSMVGPDGSSRRHLYHKLTDFILKNL